ncbi:MAG: hypothetical protein ACRESZ_21860, partial [Methylococcales bacterium]
IESGEEVLLPGCRSRYAGQGLLGELDPVMLDAPEGFRTTSRRDAGVVGPEVSGAESDQEPGR